LNAKTLFCLLFVSLNTFSPLLAEEKKSLHQELKEVSLEAKTTKDSERLNEIYEKYNSTSAIVKSISKSSAISKELSLKIAKKAISEKVQNLTL